MLTTAAILGRAFSLALLEALEAGGSDDEVLDAIEEAERAHLVAAEPAGREPRYRFAHELIRQTLAEALSLLWALAHEGSPAAETVLRDIPWQMPKRGRIPKFGDWFALAAVVEALALLGRREEAAALIEPAEDFVGTGVQYLRSQMSSTIAGIAATCAREWSRAEAHHQLAIRQADAAYRVSQPHARLWYADMLLSRNAPGDRERARSLLSEALSLYESMGMPGFARRTSARLAAALSDV